MRYCLCRGARDLQGVVGRRQSRSKYGTEKPSDDATWWFDGFLEVGSRRGVFWVFSYQEVDTYVRSWSMSP